MRDRQRRFKKRRKMCAFCLDRGGTLDFKDAPRLRRFITERGKIIPRRISGNCARHQRRVTRAIKQARLLALMPYIPQLPVT